MRVLLVSYLFDNKAAEGICTGRLVRALLDQGVEVTLFTSEEADISLCHEKFSVTTITSSRLPETALRVLRQLYCAPGIDIPWCWKVARKAATMPAPDLIYGRSFPMYGPQAARLLARKIKVPYWIHYSDPIPSPWATDASTSRIRREIKLSQRLIHAAEAVTFTTKEALLFQQQTTRIDLSRKAFVLPHVAPPATNLPGNVEGDPSFVYIGSFYGKRNPQALLQGFSLHLKHSPRSTFTFVGSVPDSVRPVAEQFGVTSAIRILPPTNNVLQHMKDADVLVGLDSSYGAPVFMTTKIIEYLMVNRRVLMITPEQSPSTKLLQRLHPTAVAVRENAEVIAAAFTNILKLQPSPEDYDRRFRVMQEFSPEAVARTFLQESAKFRAFSSCSKEMA